MILGGFKEKSLSCLHSDDGKRGGVDGREGDLYKDLL